MSDTLRRARELDPQALGRLYDEHAPAIYAYLYRRIGSAQEAEELTGDVFVRLLETLRSDGLGRAPLRAWLYRVAHNLAVDHLRRGRPDPWPDEALQAAAGAEPSPEELLSGNGLASALAALTADQQQVLALRFGEGLTAPAVAEIVDKSVGAVVALQHRALAALRRLLEDGEHDNNLI